jgi:hypothetical protein
MVLAALLAALRVSGCLDADPLGPEEDRAGLAVHVSVLGSRGAGKSAAADSLGIRLYDVTSAPYTDEPESFPLAAEAVSYLIHEDVTGRFYDSEIRVDLLEERTFRVVARLSFEARKARETVRGERTVSLRPGDRKSLGMVMTAAGSPPSGSYGLAIGKSVARPGARRHGIPVVLRNGDPLGGVQFQIRFDGSAVDSVLGIEVDPSSRLYAGSAGDSLIGSRYAQPTDSTLRVLTVDLAPVEADTIGGELRSIPPGDDLLFFVLVDLGSEFPVLPDTIRLSLEDVYFSTPSGANDIAVTDTTNGLLVLVP